MHKRGSGVKSFEEDGGIFQCRLMLLSVVVMERRVMGFLGV